MIVGVGKSWGQCPTSNFVKTYPMTNPVTFTDPCGGGTEYTQTTGTDYNTATINEVFWSSSHCPVAFCEDFNNPHDFHNYNVSSTYEYTFSECDADVGYDPHHRGCLIVNTTGHGSGGSCDAKFNMLNIGSWNPSVYKYVVVRYRINVKSGVSTAGDMELFYVNDNNPAPSSDYVKRISYSTNGEANWTTYVAVFDFSNDTKWTGGGHVTGWRLDPCTKSGIHMCIDYVALTSTPPYGSNYATSKTVNNPTASTVYYSDRIHGWTPTSCVTHTIYNFNAGAINSTGATICYGATGSISTITQTTPPSGGSGNYTYQWYHNGNAISGATNATYKPANSYASQAGDHTFTRTVSDGTTTVQSTGQYTLTVLPQLSVTPSPLSPTITYGQSVDINVVTSPYGQVSTSGLPGGVSYKTSNGHITGTPTAAGTYNYTVSVTDAGQCGPATASGTITVSPKSVTLTCPSAVTKTYDGTALNPAATVSGTINNESAGIEYSKKNGNTWGAWSSTVPSITNAGTQDVKVRITNSNYSAPECTYTLKVNQRTVTVSVEDATKTYNGSEQSGNTSYTFGNVVSGHTATITYNASHGTNVSGSPYDNGSYGNDFKVMNGSTNVTSNYTLGTQTKGKLTITKATLNITVNGSNTSEVYNGSSQSYTGTVTPTSSSTGFVANKFSYSGTKTVSGTNVGDYTAAISTSNCSYNDGNYTVNWTAGTPVKLTITPATINLTCPSGNALTKVYDGTELHPAATATGVGSDNITVEYSKDNGSTWSTTVAGITNAGSQAVKVRAKNANYNDATCEYTLTVSKAPMAITVNGSNTSKVYNGSLQSYTGTVTPTSNTTGFNSNKFSYTGNKTASGTNVGDYTTTLVENSCSYNDNNYQVTWTIGTPVKLTITKASMDITVNGSNTSKVYNGSVQNYEGTVTGTGTGFDASKFSYTGTKTVSGQNVGDYTANIDVTKCSYNDGN